jgi:ssDNA-binding Zn-finger/Zn-ribbon topoisomerase 1
MPYLVKERRGGKEIVFCGGCGYIFNGYYNFFLSMEKKICPHCGKEIYPSFSDGTFPHIEEKATHIENPPCPNPPPSPNPPVSPNSSHGRTPT